MRPEHDSVDDRKPAPIHIESLGVRYGWFSPPVLEAVDLEVSPGEVRVLLGRNGEGKSSLVRCLLGFQKPTRGRIELFGKDVWRHRARLMHRVGVVPEEPDAPPGMTPLQLSRFCRGVHRRWDEKTFRSRLERFDIPLGKNFGKLSKGQKGQVQLALALGHSPDLLVLDDPTLGLDAVARRALFEELIDELAERGVTVLLTSHDLAGVETIATRVTLLSRSRVRCDEDLEILRERVRRVDFVPRDEMTDVRIQEILEPWRPLRVEPVGRGRSVLVEGFEPALTDRLASSGATGIEVGRLGLEEIFLALVGPEAPGAGGRTDADREEAA